MLEIEKKLMIEMTPQLMVSYKGTNAALQEIYH